MITYVSITVDDWELMQAALEGSGRVMETQEFCDLKKTKKEWMDIVRVLGNIDQALKVRLLEPGDMK